MISYLRNILSGCHVGYHEDSFISSLEVHFRLQVRRLK